MQRLSWSHRATESQSHRVTAGRTPALQGMEELNPLQLFPGTEFSDMNMDMNMDMDQT